MPKSRLWSLSIMPSLTIAVSVTVGAALAQPAASPQPGTTGPLRFEDFPAHTPAPDRNADLVLTGRARTYRTRLRAAAAGRPNFAGHYILVTWGCGTECLMGAAINARTGRVIFLPFATCCISQAPEGTEDMVTFRRDSALIRLVGFRDDRQTSQGSHDFRVTGDRFEHLRYVPFPVRR